MQKHCNRCWTLHKTFTIATERLYLHKTCATDVPEELQVACATHNEEFRKIRSLEFVKKCLTDYRYVKDNALAGRFGEIAQYRFQYCNLVNLQQMLHYVINVSDFDQRNMLEKSVTNIIFVRYNLRTQCKFN